MTVLSEQELAIRGGPPAVADWQRHEPLFHWPIVTSEDEQAVLDVLRAGSMSGKDVTMAFEREFADWLQVEHALGFCNGTAALQAAMWAVGLGRGDELICPSVTYWASALQAFSLGATVVFADIHPDSLCIDPADIEHRISERTKAIMVVHYCGHPADMDAILPIARRHGLRVIEDNSHAHGTLYKGRLTGTLGDVAAMSMMAGKSFAIGEAGMLTTDDAELFERAVAFAHYKRHGRQLTRPDLTALAGLPLGGVKGRMNQTCAAMGRVQLRHYPRRMAEIQSALHRFWDALAGVPGLRPHHPPAEDGSTMGGWYNPLGHYVPEELGDLPVARFIEAVQAECGRCGRGINFPLHLHPVFNEADIYGDGKPTRLAFADRDVRQGPGSLPVAEGIAERAFGIPWLKRDVPEIVEQYAEAYRKVAAQAEKLLAR